MNLLPIFITPACRTNTPLVCCHNQYGKDCPLPRKPGFGSHLRDARIKRGLSVAEVAEEVGVSIQTIYFWENNHVRPRDENLSALCRVLKLPVRATREMAAGH